MPTGLRRVGVARDAELPPTVPRPDRPIASACSKSSLPFRTARRVNSPGSAWRAPARIAAASTDVGARYPPWVVISRRSSPVNEAGATKRVAITSSSSEPSLGSTTCVRIACLATRGAGRRRRSAISATSGPESRTIASAPRPGAVAIAAMVRPSPSTLASSAVAGRRKSVTRRRRPVVRLSIRRAR